MLRRTKTKAVMGENLPTPEKARSQGVKAIRLAPTNERDDELSKIP